VFTFKVLGGPVLTGPQGPVTGRAAYRRRTALLAVLAVARGRPVGRDRLIGLLWPEHAGDAARHTLSEALYVLRRELGADLFITVGDEVALSPARVRTDVGAFEEALEEGRLEDAVREYGGPLLEGFFVDDAPDFERWVDGERDRLARARAAALEKLAEGAEAGGRRMEAVEWWRSLAAHDPYSSRVVLRLVQLLDAAGERAAALRAAAAHAARMRDELGVEPGEALAAFVEQLRAEPPAAPRTSSSSSAMTSTSNEGGADRPNDEDGPEDGDGAEDGGRPEDRGRSADGDRAAGVSSPRPEAPRLPEAAALAAGPAATARGRGGAWGRRWTVAAAVVATLGGLAAAALRPSSPPPAAPGYDPRRIAVLYFEDDSPRGELGYLATGLTAELIDQLSRVPALDVASRNAVKAYRDGEVSLDSLVARLQVGTVVEGSVQRSGDSVRVRVQLVDTGRRSPMVSRTVMRRLDDLFALEQAVGDEISAALRRRLGQEVRLRQAASETRSGQALALVLRAEEAREQAARLARRPHPLDAASALRALARADSLLALAQGADPRWARPRVLRGAVTVARADLSPAGEQLRLLAGAVAAADGVLAREPRHPGALALRGRAGWKLAVASAGDTLARARLLGRAERDLRAALDADDSQAAAWATLSQLLRFRGRFAESDLAARTALDQDAWLDDAGKILLDLYYGAMAQGDYAAAREVCARGHAQFAGDWRFVQCRLTLLREDASATPDPRLAWALVAELDRLYPAGRARDEGSPYEPLYRRMAAAAVLARAGAADSARAVVARLRARAAADPELRIPLMYDEAYVAVFLGDRAGARRLLDAYLAERPALRAYVARDAVFRDLFTGPPASPR
jgi:DNA-binding SARP family transcriptional activator/TolB-like protein